MSDDFKSMSELLGDQVSHGERMGFKQGGHVKMPRQGHGHMTTGKQKSMDDGVQPRRRGRDQQEVEAGGMERVRPGYRGGGQVTDKEVQRARKKSPKKKRARKTTGAQMTDKEAQRVRAASAKGMPKDVKAKGGKARKPYTGYNDQPGGSGNEDKRYMEGKAKGGKTGYRTGGPVAAKEGGALAAARKVMKEHVRADKPAGHGVKKARGGRTMVMGKGGYKGKHSGGRRKAHSSTPMIGH